MAQIEKIHAPGFWASVINTFSLFLRMGKKSRRTKVFFAISLLPVIIAAIVKLNHVFSSGGGREGIYIFSNIIMAFYLQFLILVLALFFGTSICSEELEGKTLTYLTTRPVPKSAIMLGKYAAYTLLIVFMVVLGVTLSFVLLNMNRLLDFSLYPIFFRDLGVLTLGMICYTAFFAFLGTFLKKSVLFGLLFSFGWENVIQYFPGTTQKFTIVHYLKSLLPGPSTGGFSFLLFRLEPSPTGVSIFMLLLITAVFLSLACLFFSKKEYILD
jgi:ABC-type transport system involved in multi-copper enzyme maturation permease subunit